MTEKTACDFRPAKKTVAIKQTITIDKRFSRQELPIEADRYRLILGKFCPWATQVAIEIDYLGLDQVISKGVIWPLRRADNHADWMFGAKDNDQDPVLKTSKLSQNYQKTIPGFDGRPSVPALIDIKTGQVVNNVTDVLLDELALCWANYFDQPHEFFYPPKQRSEFKVAANTILHKINEIPGKILNVKSQSEYERLAGIFFKQLAKFEKTLQQQDYLWGDHLTQLDIRLFASLVRFDLVYYYQNKLNYRRLTDYPALWAYAKRLYQIPAFKNNTDFHDIKQHFYRVDDHDIDSFEQVVPMLDEQRWAN
ncbi:glutathione S-transferase [Liquorilactobacillus aquaticus DSM 21051]|uniref:Glutathione S-transferase n=1 Tax=Liquorilactobacillus aquaticus DSM 21051 TaxID=1423725 RepID=A0A0R2D414_9LACO|nr:glutathione S-transferase C-terminal domain-containing protein [Liquorilactobacillus aquaticus]KRM95078.1 glutathione S-transferase [Liquorilactobacillus aquaticus DSM 21051]